MAVKKDNIISYRLTFVVVCVFAFSIAIAVKLFNIQWVGGEYYRNLAKQRTVKNFDIPANKGNIYSSDGSLLATSIPEYTIRFDAVAPSDENFEKKLCSTFRFVSTSFRETFRGISKRIEKS